MKTLAFLLLATVVASAHAADFDAATDFSTINNPTGVWSYLQAPSLASLSDPSARTLLGPETVRQGIDFWGFRDATQADIEKNNTGSAYNFDGRVSMAPGQLTLHPGGAGQYSVLRFTSPGAASYTLTSEFRACDIASTGGIDVHLLVNGSSLLDADLTFLSSRSDVRAIRLAPGDVLEYAVGYGADAYFSGDSVATTARLQAVPEPTSMVALGLGAVALLRRRRS